MNKTSFPYKIGIFKLFPRQKLINITAWYSQLYNGNNAQKLQ